MNKVKARSLNIWDAIALTVGSMIGAGIFTVLSLTVRTAGPSAVVSWILVVVLSLPMAYTFSDLTGVLAQSGGPYIYLRDKVGPWLGLWVAWSFLLSAVGASAALFISLVGMLDQLHVQHAYIVSYIVLCALVFIVLAGIHIGATVQRVFTIATVAILVVCIAIGFWHAAWLPDLALSNRIGMHRAVSSSVVNHVLFPSGWVAVLPATFFAFWTYSGWEAVAVPSGAYRDRTALAKGMMFGSILVGVLYVCVALAAILSVPTRVIGQNMNPMVAVGNLWSPLIGKLVGWGAIVIVVSSLLSWLIASSTLLQSVMRDGLVPAPKAVVNVPGEYHPVVVLVIGLVLGILAKLPLFSAMIAASSMTALMPYAVVFLVVSMDRDANWPGVIKTPGRRRLMAAQAFAMAIVLIVFSGWSNIWPTLVLLLVGGGVVFSRREKYGRVSDVTGG